MVLLRTSTGDDLKMPATVVDDLLLLRRQNEGAHPAGDCGGGLECARRGLARHCRRSSLETWSSPAVVCEVQLSYDNGVCPATSKCLPGATLR